MHKGAHIRVGFTAWLRRARRSCCRGAARVPSDTAIAWKSRVGAWYFISSGKTHRPWSQQIYLQSFAKSTECLWWCYRNWTNCQLPVVADFVRAEETYSHMHKKKLSCRQRTSARTRTRAHFHTLPMLDTLLVVFIVVCSDQLAKDAVMHVWMVDFKFLIQILNSFPKPFTTASSLI